MRQTINAELLAALKALVFAAESPTLTPMDAYVLSQPVRFAKEIIAKTAPRAALKE